jgi:hypothetical protein
MWGMIAENQFDCGSGRIGGINELEAFDELSTAMTVSDQGMDLPREQINPSQQAHGPMAFVLMITQVARHGQGPRLAAAF